MAPSNPIKPTRKEPDPPKAPAAPREYDPSGRSFRQELLEGASVDVYAAPLLGELVVSVTDELGASSSVALTEDMAFLVEKAIANARRYLETHRAAVEQ